MKDLLENQPLCFERLTERKVFVQVVWSVPEKTKSVLRSHKKYALKYSSGDAVSICMI